MNTQNFRSYMSIKPAVDEIFNQLSWLLAQLSNDEYSQVSPQLNGASVGQHVRHTLEFFKCLIDGSKTGSVNYDLRERDIFLESNTLQAKALIEELIGSFDSMEEKQEIDLIQSYGEGSEPICAQSNVLRELVYNLEHAVHHMALIRIGLREVKPKLKLEDSFGVASSTIRYKKSQLINH